MDRIGWGEGWDGGTGVWDLAGTGIWCRNKDGTRIGMETGMER